MHTLIFHERLQDAQPTDVGSFRAEFSMTTI